MNPAVLYAAVETPFGLSLLLQWGSEHLDLPGEELLEPDTRTAAVTVPIAPESFGRVTISSLMERQDRPTEPTIGAAARAA